MITMTLTEQLITVAMCIAGTLSMRALPFIVFSSKKPTPRFVRYIGNALPAAVFALLVVFCLKNVSITAAPHGLPELIAISAVVAVQLWRKNTLISIAVGTVLYMILIRSF